MFYNKLELTISEDDPLFRSFGKEVDELLCKYQDYLVGYFLEDISEQSIDHCYDASYKESEIKIKEIYRIGEQS